MTAVKAITAGQLALASDGVFSVTLDEAIEAMRLTAAGAHWSLSAFLSLQRLTPRFRYERQIQGDQLVGVGDNGQDSADFACVLDLTSYLLFAFPSCADIGLSAHFRLSLDLY